MSSQDNIYYKQGLSIVCDESIKIKGGRIGLLKRSELKELASLMGNHVPLTKMWDTLTSSLTK